jgi:hypothetical protein
MKKFAELDWKNVTIICLLVTVAIFILREILAK